MIDAVEGDLFELYTRRIKRIGKKRSNLLYFFNVLTFFQPFAIQRNQPNRRLNTIDMFRNYLRIAVRTLMKTKSVAAINILGLAIGIASFIMIISYVINEFSFDTFHNKADRIVRVIYSYEARGETRTISRIAFPLKYRLLESYPEVEKVVRFYQNRIDATTLKYEDNLFTEEKIYFTDPEVFDVFDFKLVVGDPSTALATMNSIVLTEEAAMKYFGKENPMGKTILYKNDNLLEVKGIVKKTGKSHIDFDFLVPVELQRQRWIGEESNNGYDLEKDWKWSGSWMYVLLKNASMVDAFNERLDKDGEDLFGRVENPRVDYNHHSQPLLDIHLNDELVSEIGVTGNLKQVYGFAVIAFLILIIACINFVNLTTAQSTNRAKEIGLRKVMGAQRKNLIGQFITESVLVTFIASIFGLLLLELMVPIFNNFMDQDLSIPYLRIPQIAGAIFLGTIVIGILAGAYPSFYLSKLLPVTTLKGTFAGTKSNSGVRKLFVITQFVVSNILILGIIVIHLQIEFIKGKDLGFEREQTIVMKHGTKMDDHFQVLKTRLMENPKVAGVSQGYVAGTGDWVQSFRVEGEDTEEGKSLGFKHIGFDFLEFFGLEMASGRYFSPSFGTDSTSAILINEATARVMGWSNEEALGKSFSWYGGSDNKTFYKTKVIGVMKDANFESLYEPVQPSVFKLSFFGDIAIKFKANSTDELFTAVEAAEEVWSDISPQWPFEFTFLDQYIQDQYKKEERLGQMIQFFAALAIFIACMGLFGLATFTVERRTKEIGVRKVLGAGIWRIAFTIMKGFLLLVVFSLIISVPVGYYLSQNWLHDFAYRIDLHPFIFIVSSIASVLVAGLAVLSQSLSAAKLDPVVTLRYE